jgi:hypothetical protein
MVQGVYGTQEDEKIKKPNSNDWASTKRTVLG